MPTETIPIIVAVPVAALLVNAVRIALPAGEAIQNCRITRVDGYLAALVSGTLTVEIRDLLDDTLIATLAWTATGHQSVSSLDYMLDQSESGLAIAPTGVGVGAQLCLLTIWTLMSF